MTFPLPQHVLGSFGQILRAGPFYATDGVTARNMSLLTVTCERYDKHGTTEGPSPGAGTTDGYIEYRVAEGDFGSVGIWTYRVFADDVDERLASELGQIRVVEPSGL